MLCSFQPFVNQNTRTLILGTMPGATSLEKQEYYAYRQNHFWRIIFTAFDALPVPDDFQKKITLLQQNNIGLWDVLQNCEREGSLDSKIKNQVENDFESLFAEFPKIKILVFNGKEAHRYFIKKFGQIEGLRYHIMPSTSPANTTRFDMKLEIWSKVLK